MKSMRELEQEIKAVRAELEEEMVSQLKFEEYYQKSLRLDRLLEEYIERKSTE